MDKKICAFIFTVAFVTLSGVVHSNPQNVQRGPSVEPIVEVDIETANKAEITKDAGFNFAPAAERLPATEKSRTPANIVSKAGASSAVSYLGPIIFLIALPFGLWIMVSKKFSKKSAEDKAVGYFPKTHQFNPYKTDYQKSSDDDDDMDYPKAS
jgi:hypothetical protein